MLAKLPPVWVLLFLLTAGLGMGALSLSAPWTSRPAAYEDTLPLRASMAQAAGDYDYHRKRGWDLDEINLFFSDDAPLHISSKVASEPLLAKLKAYPAGTVLDMRLDPDSMSVMSLSVNGMDILTYEAACRAIHLDNGLGFLLGIFCLFMAGYAAWGLCMAWKYRKLT